MASPRGDAGWDTLSARPANGSLRQRGPTLTHVDITDPRGLAEAAAQAGADKKATDIRLLELGELLGITDFFVIMSAGNERQLDTVAQEIEYRLKQAGRRVRRREGAKETGWILLDYGEIVVHAFTEEQRAYYDLERLWSDAPATTFQVRAPADV